MSRKTLTYTVESDDRDHGKKFLLTEMSSRAGEDWATDAIMGLAQSNVEVPDGFLELGMAGMAEIGLKKFFAIQTPLMKQLGNRLLLQVQMMPNPTKPTVLLGPGAYDSQVEEISTWFKLKWEVLKLHIDFSKAADLSKLVANFSGVTQGESK